MGEPIKVGERFGNYNDMRTAIIHRYNNRPGFNVTCSNLGGGAYSETFNVNKDLHVYVQGKRFANNAEIYADWNDGNRSIYSTEYEPVSKKQDPTAPNIDFTTIYDYGCDKTGKEFYMKATDINGNNFIDEGEITYYDSFDDLFKK